LAGVESEYPTLAFWTNIKAAEILDSDVFTTLDSSIDFVQESINNAIYLLHILTHSGSDKFNEFIPFNPISHFHLHLLSTKVSTAARNSLAPYSFLSEFAE
jgi:hypothetical protein